MRQNEYTAILNTDVRMTHVTPHNYCNSLSTIQVSNQPPGNTKNVTPGKSTWVVHFGYHLWRQPAVPHMHTPGPGRQRKCWRSVKNVNPHRMSYQLSLSSLLLCTLISCLQVVRGPGCKQATIFWGFREPKSCKGNPPQMSQHTVSSCSLFMAEFSLLTLTDSSGTKVHKYCSKIAVKSFTAPINFQWIQL